MGTDYTTVIRDIFTQLQSAKAEMILCFVVIAIGYILKTIPAFPNRFIPVTCIALSGAVYPLISDESGRAPYQMRFPIVREIIIGLLIGFVAWALHRAFLKNWLDKYFPQVIDKKGDTKLFPKPPE